MNAYLCEYTKEMSVKRRDALIHEAEVHSLVSLHRGAARGGETYRESAPRPSGARGARTSSVVVSR